MLVTLAESTGRCVARILRNAGMLLEPRNGFVATLCEAIVHDGFHRGGTANDDETVVVFQRVRNGGADRDWCETQARRPSMAHP
jgi:hypothetical protein